jgi:flagellar biosynthesis protein FlhB
MVRTYLTPTWNKSPHSKVTPKAYLCILNYVKLTYILPFFLLCIMMGFVATLHLFASNFNKDHQMFTLYCLHPTRLWMKAFKLALLNYTKKYSSIQLILKGVNNFIFFPSFSLFPRTSCYKRNTLHSLYLQFFS